MPAVSGLQETFAGLIDFVLLDYDDDSHDAKRRELGITAQAQYVLVNAAGEIVKKWFGALDQGRVVDELQALLS